MLSACRLMLRPVVRMLLAHGILWKDFAGLARRVYVEVAGEDYGIAGRQTNASRVAILTGLTRREVKRQRDLIAARDAGQPDRIGNATRVLSGWYQDPDFTDAAGRPLALPREGGDASFAALHERYGGDIPAVALLKELLHAGAVEEGNDGRYRAIRRYYMPHPGDPAAVTRSGGVVADLARTVAWNLGRGESGPPRFEGRATETGIPTRLVPRFRDFLEEHGQGLLELADAWLTAHRDEATPSRTTRLGVGVYMIEGTEESGG